MKKYKYLIRFKDKTVLQGYIIGKSPLMYQIELTTSYKTEGKLIMPENTIWKLKSSIKFIKKITNKKQNEKSK